MPEIFLFLMLDKNIIGMVGQFKHKHVNYVVY